MFLSCPVLKRVLAWTRQKQISGLVLPLIFYRYSSFDCCSSCSLIKVITPKMCILCFVLINIVLLNLSCVWNLF